MKAPIRFPLFSCIVFSFPFFVFLASCGGGGGSNPTPNPTPAPTPSTANEWTWMGGSSTNGAVGVYGTLGTPAAANIPGGRYNAVGWADGSGNFWLFGGNGYASTSTQGLLNDVWEFSPTTKQWTWVSGSSTVGAMGNYGTLGVPAADNAPPGLAGAVSWTDISGNLWLFGGDGYAADGKQGLLDDLWEFNPTTKMWTWMSGNGTENSAGVYGTMGMPASTNTPGGRDLAVSWIDSSGNLWLLGGYGIDTAEAQGPLNDFWEFSSTTREWTWVGGSYRVGAESVYGTQGTPAADNRPGGRSEAVSWTDSSGNFWLFGGYGFVSNGTQDLLNDLWEFSPTTSEWTWIGGSTTGSAVGVYGTLGVPAAGNVPPGLAGAVSWIDRSGNSWLFGGDFDALWEYNPTTKEWTWINGSSAGGAAGVYGTLGAPSAANVPGVRSSAASWIDGSGNLWLFGGLGNDSNGSGGSLNDLWRYQP